MSGAVWCFPVTVRTKCWNYYSLLNSCTICCHPVIIYSVTHYGDRVLGHSGGVCPVHIVAYGVLKVFFDRWAKPAFDTVSSIGSHAELPPRRILGSHCMPHDSHDKLHSTKGNVFDKVRAGGRAVAGLSPPRREDRVQLVPVGFVVNGLTLVTVFS